MTEVVQTSLDPELTRGILIFCINLLYGDYLGLQSLGEFLVYKGDERGPEFLAGDDDIINRFLTA